MSKNAAAEKQTLRETVKKRLDLLTPAEAAKKSVRIREKLYSLESFKKARGIAFYASFAAEVDTADMIDEALALGKRVFLPRYDRVQGTLFFHEVKDRAGLTRGALGISEPPPGPEARPEDIDCIIVPGLAFDKAKNRLGRGAGCYDRFLARLRPETTKIGLAFAFQLVERVPVEAHDRPLDRVITD